MSEAIFSHTSKIRVRYSETDKMGFAYNGNYLAYFEIGRTELMRHNGMPYVDFENNGYQIPLTDAGLQFIAPAKYDDELEINAKLYYDGGARMKFVYEITRNGILLTTGHTSHCFINAVTKRAVKPPEDFLKIFYRKSENNS